MNARVRALAVLVAVFLFGFSAGLAVYHAVKSNVPSALTAAPGGPNRPPGRERGPRLPELLDLSASQRAQFESIMKEIRRQFEAVRTEQMKKLDPIDAEFRPKFDAVREEMAPKFDAVRAEMNRRIAGILNEEQKKKFEAFQKEREAREGRGGPGGPGRRRQEHQGGPPDPR